MIGKLLGHRQIQMTARYAHLVRGLRESLRREILPWLLFGAEFDPLEPKTVNGLERRSASNTHAE